MGWICFTGGALEEIISIVHIDNETTEYHTQRGPYRERRIIEKTPWCEHYEHTVYERMLGVRGWVPCTVLIREIILRD